MKKGVVSLFVFDFPTTAREGIEERREGRGKHVWDLKKRERERERERGERDWKEKERKKKKNV